MPLTLFRCFEEQQTDRLVIAFLDGQDFELIHRARIEEFGWYGDTRCVGSDVDAINAQRILSRDDDLVTDDRNRSLRRI